MKEFTYSQVVSMVCYWLEKYPHVGVALECVLEDVEGHGDMAREVRAAMESVNTAGNDVQVHAKVLSNWADQTGSKDLETLATRLVEATEKGEDIGLYSRRFFPTAELYKDREEFKKRNNRQRGRGGRSRNRRFNGNRKDRD